MTEIIILINGMAYGFILLILSIVYIIVGIGMTGVFLEQRYSDSYNTPRGIRRVGHRLILLVVSIGFGLFWPLVILWNFFVD